jgi:thiamine-phosphate pyrophosphorylase
VAEAEGSGIGPARGSSSTEGTRRRKRLAASRLYVVTGARDLHERGALGPFLDGILGAGVDIVQLREKDAEGGDLLRWGRVFREVAGDHGALFVVNDRADVATALSADGVHVGQNDLPVALTRRLVGADVLVGLSTHDRDQLSSASPEADYVCAGPVHETPTKPGRPATGIELIREAGELEGRPWFAIGGIDARTLPNVVAAGARRIVVVRAVTEASDPAVAVRDLISMLPPVDGGSGS